MKLKYIPNTITLSRIVLTAFLIFLTPLGPASIVVFLLAGVTDMVDGVIARRIKDAKTELGAELDSLADMFMVLVSVFVILPAMGLWPQLWWFFIAALVFKLLSSVPGIVKHRKVFLLHTISNKILALLLFTGAILYFIFGAATGVNVYFVFLIVAVFVITLEEMIIISMLDYPNKDIKGIWQVKKVNEAYRSTLAESAER